MLTDGRVCAVNAIAKLPLGQAMPDQAAEATNRLRTALIDLRPTAALATRAMALALELAHPVHDCFYLALAEIGGAGRTSLKVEARRSMGKAAGR
jgi:predicted nucleic acid-binding protein